MRRRNKQFVNTPRNSQSPYRAAEQGFIDEVIQPRDTRFKLIQALEMAKNKSQSNPPKNMEIFPCSNYYLRKIKASSCREDSLEVKRSRFNCFVPGFFIWIIKVNKKAKRYDIYGKHAIFVPESVPHIPFGMWIKRESGVNPGQSRCCEAPKNILKQHYRHWF